MTETVSLVIDPRFKSLLDPLEPVAFSMLKQSIIKAGRATDPLIVWKENGTLIDGHHRHAICTENNLPFDVFYESHPDIESALDSARSRALARRNLNENARDYHIGKLYRETKLSPSEAGAQKGKSCATETPESVAQLPESTASKLAADHDIKPATVRKFATFSQAADTLAADGAPLTRILEQPKATVISAAKQPEPIRKQAAQTITTDKKKKLKKAINEAKRAEVVAAGNDIGIAIANADSKPNKPLGKEPPRVEIGGHVLLFGDNSDAAILAQLPDHVALAFCDPPYNSTGQAWDGSHTWTHDWLIELADIVVVTPGISAIHDFMRQTAMPYRWSTATYISNGMTRGALGFGNWMYTALFSNLKSLHKNAQDHYETSINSSDKFEDHALGAQRQKPPGYLTWLFDLLTKPGEIILDPFAGSGTSVIAAHRLGRRCIAIEKDESTYQAMVRRVRITVENQTAKKGAA